MCGAMTWRALTFNQVLTDLSCFAGHLREDTTQRKATGHEEVATMEGTHTTEHLANEARALCLILRSAGNAILLIQQYNT